MQNNSIFAELKDIKNKDDLPDRSVKVYIDADEAKKTLDIQGGGGGQSGEDTIELHIDWNMLNQLVVIGHPETEKYANAYLCIYDSSRPEDTNSVLLDKDGNVFSGLDLYNAITSNKRIIIEDFPAGCTYDISERKFYPGLAGRAELIYHTAETDYGGNKMVVAYAIAPMIDSEIIPLGEIGLSVPEGAEWGDTSPIGLLKEEEGDEIVIQASVFFGFYRQA